MKRRLFLAIEMPPQISSALADVQNQLEKLRLPVRWEAPEKFHLTTNFIGKVDEDTHAKIAGILPEIIANHRPFSLTPAFLETMYRKHEGSYVYFGPSGQMDELLNLQSDLRAGILSLDLPQPDKYLPHITIGKLVKMDPVMTKDVLFKIGLQEIGPLPKFTVDRLTVYESLLSRDGSHYRKIGRHMLQ